ncbi:MAG TPA: M48 family metallopeptidase [Nitrospiria bacterium]|nr:M48 family metallopeptidase [Nitrospiria bacterium]
MKIYLFLIIIAYIFKEAFKYLVIYMNLNRMRRKGDVVPPEFNGKINREGMKKTVDYQSERVRFGLIASLFNNIVIITFTFCGLLSIYNRWITSLNLPFIFAGWLFFILLFYANEILSIPFGLYSSFKIEARYGFNTMTPRLWLSDFLKSISISTAMNSLLILAGLLLIQWAPDSWWIWVWAFILAYSMFIMYISPYVIEPLFNKFAPIDDESLREKIIRLTDKAGIHVGRILKMDASKRSRHTNAYFTGIGKTKRIVLFDTLLSGMDQDEIIAVLAHEIGHWKGRHILKMMVISAIVSLVALFLTFRLTQSDLLLRLFNISTDTLFAKLFIISFLAGIVGTPLKWLMSSISRRHEREADRTSYELTSDGERMVSALVKLSKENLSNLYPHPLYVAIYYSHPPVVERIRYIRSLAR